MNLPKIGSICYVKDPSICANPDEPSVAMKKVVVLALPGARELDLASVLDVFTLANWQLASNPAYQVEVVTSDPKGRVTGMTGLKLAGTYLTSPVRAKSTRC